MEYIWSPWRMVYMQSNMSLIDCIFCTEQSKPDGFDNLIIHRGSNAYVILNRYPYTTGHLMTVPYIHEAQIESLEPLIRAEIMELTSKSIQVLKSVYKPHGFNVGINLGEVAGAGILSHIHLHVVPRWKGDTNFMSTLGQTRVLPETLDTSYQRILDAWQNMNEKI